MCTHMDIFKHSGTPHMQPCTLIQMHANTPTCVLIHSNTTPLLFLQDMPQTQ